MGRQGSRRRSASRRLRALVVLAAFALAGCGAAAGPTTQGPATAAPALDTVTPLADPRSYDGPSTALVGDVAVHPVADNPQQQLPVTVTDAQGTKVTVTDTSRVLALDLYGTLSRTVFELGLGDRLVGRDITSDFAEIADLPLVTRGGHDLNAEAILGLNPTLVMTDTSLGPWDVVLQIRDAGIPVVVTEPARNLDTIATITRQVATAMGVPEAGEALVDRTAKEVATVRAQIDAVAPAAVTDKLRAVFIYARGASGVYYLFGEGSGADSLITTLGLYDVAKEIGWNGSKPLTDEGIVAAQPDVILMMTKGLESVGGVDGLLDRFPALANTPAGQHRRIVDMDDSKILGYGPLTAKALNALAVAIYAPAAVAGK